MLDVAWLPISILASLESPRQRHRSMPATITSLGPCLYDSPLRHTGGGEVPFKTETDRILVNHHEGSEHDLGHPISFEVAGPREKIFFDPPKTTAAIVTCGGLCPGLNDIIKGIVTQCHNRYAVTKVFGFRYGYEGMIQRYGHTPMLLKPESVSQIHNFGGTILGTSRGPQDVGEMVDVLEEMKIDIFFVVGGDGTLRGAATIQKEIERRGLKKAIVGIPKTIDNDIMYLDKSFGFETAFAMAVQSVKCAHIESIGSMNGIGLIRLMGRDSGFIACYAALAGGNVDFVLVPEVKFDLQGDRGLLEVLRYRLAKKKGAVIVVAEGAGQDLLKSGDERDASGNARYGDIGLFLKDRINRFFSDRKIEVQSQVYRSELHHPIRARERAGQCLLLTTGPARRARRDGGKDRNARGALARGVCSSAHFHRDARSAKS